MSISIKGCASCWLVHAEHENISRAGYTLIELVVVIALISIMFFVALPRFQDNVLTDQTRKTSRWLITQARYLKQQSVRQKIDFVLHVDMENGKFWVSNREMGEEGLEKAEKDAHRLPDDLAVMDVEFANRETVAGGQTEILFYAKGYSDKALIHLQHEDSRQLSFLIEPFLPKIKYVEEYTSFKD